MQPKKLSDAEIQNTLRSAIKGAVAFVEDEIAPERLKSANYMDGKTSLKHEEGRSKVVATKCRDAVRAIMPVLMKTFLQAEKPAEFIPRSPQAVAGAEQATQYAQYVWERNDGFRVLYDVFHDALVKKVGIIKPYFEEATDVEFDEYTGLDDVTAQFVMDDPEIEVLEAEVDEDGLWDIKASRTDKTGRIRFEAVAPEDFFIDNGASSVRDCYVCGHSTEGRVGDLVQMGFDFAEVLELAGTTTDEEEELERTNNDAEDDENAIDPSMRKILITEAYMRMDIEGTGVPKRYKFVCAGQDYKILDWELCDHLPFAVFHANPEPHAFFGKSLVDMLRDDQDAGTALLRGLLDSVALMNNPSLEVVESQVNMDDVLNNEIGAIKRVKQPGQIREMVMGTAATAALPAIQYYDEITRGKTGISGASMGMDPDALQSQTAAGVNAAVQAASAQAELHARIFAEGGMRELFEIIAELARQHPQPDEMMRIDGQFVPVDPRSWSTAMDVIANVGLGTNRHDERMMVLNQTLQTQMGIWQNYGPSNGLVTMTNMRATMADILRLGGVYNADRYYQPMTPEQEQMLMQQAAQAAQGQQQADPNMALVQVEQMKAQAKAQEAQVKLQLQSQKDAQEAQRKWVEAAAKDDLARDKMAQDAFFKTAEMQGEYQIQLDNQALKREQAQPRPYGQ